jgi:LysM repeat protein
VALAQDAALTERVNRLSVYVEELLADKARQQKQITELTRQVESLREQLERASGSASREEVAAVAQAVKELDQKHRADIKLVAKQIEDLGRASASSGSVAAPSTYERGWEYTVQQGNTLSAIAKAYRDDGHKVTVADILKANPGLDPKKLKVGQVIFIPEP